MEQEKIRVLLIGNGQIEAKIIEQSLKTTSHAEYVLTAVERFADAAERLARHEWDVIILDLSLPNGGGIDLVRRVKELAPEVPLLVVTAADDEELALGTIREGAQDNLVKGQFDGPLLLRVMHRAIERIRAALRFRPIQQTLTHVDSTVDKLRRLCDAGGSPPGQSLPPAKGGGGSGGGGRA
jgi:DNA-binding response OmpR family regulator